MPRVQPIRAILLLLCAATAAQAQSASLQDRLARARSLHTQGSARQALEIFEAALPEVRASQPPDQLLATLIDIAESASDAGDQGRALTAADEASRLASTLHDQSREGIAVNLVGQANLFLGNYPASLAAYQHALDLAEARHDVAAASIRLGNIGNVYFYQGRYTDALRTYQSALAKAEQGGAAAANGRQLALANLAILYEQLGQNENALAFYQRAAQSASALKPAEYGQLLSNMGTLYRRMGDPVKALDTYSSARQVFRRAAHSDGEIHVLHNTGLVLALDYKAPERALAAFTEALQLADSSGDRRQSMLGHLFRGEALLRMARYSEAREEYDRALALATELGAAEEQWSARYGIGQTLARSGHSAEAAAAYRDAVAVIESLRGGIAVRSLRSEFLGDKRNVYDAYIASLLDAGQTDPAALFDIFEKARARTLQDALSGSLKPLTLAALRQHLDARSLLIEYWVGTNRAAALWSTDRAAGIVPLAFTPDDAGRIRTFTAALGDGNSSWQADATGLAHVLLNGVPLDARRPNLLIVPDGVLCALPFEVLPAAPANRPLVETFAISYLPAAALLSGSRAAGHPLPGKPQLLAFGDPLPSASDTLSPGAGWARLPASAAEVAAIAHAVPGRAETHTGGDDLKRYLSSAAVTVPVVHLSTHAVVDTYDPNRSRIVFTPEPNDPGSRYLFYPEVQRLTLQGVDLVTLAACDTEAGKLVPGEGVQSFSRAFLAAGAQSTVTALWRVADRPTADFMRIFYKELAAGTPKAEALRRAKLAMLQSSATAQPLYWAAFVLTGDGRAEVPFARWPSAVLPLSALAVIAAGVLIARRLA